MSEVPARVRSQRLSNGKCPSHGGPLIARRPLLEGATAVGTIYGCADSDCPYEVDARIGSRLDKLLGVLR